MNPLNLYSLEYTVLNKAPLSPFDEFAKQFCIEGLQRHYGMTSYKSLNGMFDSNPKLAIQVFNQIEIERRDEGCSPLIIDIYESNKELFDKILQHNPSSVNFQDPYSGQAVIHVACEYGDLDRVKALAAKGADIHLCKGNRRENLPVSTLACCIEGTKHRFRDPDQLYAVFNWLLQQGVDPKIGYVYGALPILHYCLKHGLKQFADAILSKVDVNQSEPVNSWCPIHIAVKSGDYALTEQLLRMKAKVDALATEGLFSMRKLTPLHFALHQMNIPLVTLLLSHGANLNERIDNPFFQRNVFAHCNDQEPLTAYQMAVDNRSDECVDVMINDAKKRGIKIDTETPERSMFHRSYAGRSLHSLVETEIARRQHTFKIGPLNCCSMSGANIEAQQKVLSHYLLNPGTLGTAEKICRPLLDVALKYAERTPKFVVVFKKLSYRSDVVGCFNCDTKMELIVSTFLEEDRELMAIFIHEVTHMAATLKYGGIHASPTDQTFYEALEKDLATLRSSNYRNCDPVIETVLREVEAYNYPKGNHPSEYLARIPQCMFILSYYGRLSAEEIEQAFQKSIPNLYRYFMNEFIPGLASIWGKAG